MAVSKRTRYEVLRRDNHACRYCGASAPDAKLTVDHVLPVHKAQVITYLRLMNLRRGLLINFNVPRLADGIQSILNG